MKVSTSLLVLVALSLSACGSDKESKTTPSPENQKIEDPKTGPQPDDQQGESDIHVLQLTVLNFLRGGLEPCNVTNKQFHFTMKDKERTVPICKNSKVEVYATSDSGTVTFHARDLVVGIELPPAKYSVSQVFELGKTKEMLRYGVENPYGFTYVMAEEVTGFDPELLTRWNELNIQLSKEREKVLIFQRDGKPVPQELLDKIAELEEEMRKVAEEMEKTRKK